MKHSSNGKTAVKSGSNGKTKNLQPDNGLRQLFEDQLKDMYWAEKALTKALPKMIKKACSPELVESLEDHLAVTEKQVTRCEEVFAALDMKASAKKCEAMEGLIAEATEIMSEAEEGSVRDAGIIAAAQKVEHYEIASYGTLVAWAKQLGQTKAATLLEKTLKEEKEADLTLTEVAESFVNEEATMEE